MKTRLVLLAAAALPLAACDNMGMDSAADSVSAVPAADVLAASQVPASMTPTTAMPYVMLAGASDMYEKMSSRMAMDKASSADVKAFARNMIEDHSRTTETVMAAARSAGMTPPAPKLTPMQADMLAELEPLSGAAFDQAYTMQQKKAHDMALSLHNTYAQQGDTPALKTAAQGAVPIIQQHRSLLTSLP